jgi:hypothetical protein
MLVGESRLAEKRWDMEQQFVLFSRSLTLLLH